LLILTPNLSISQEIDNEMKNLMKYQMEKKNQGVAALLSLLIVGSGQFYNGEVGKGTLFLLTGIISAGMMATYEEPEDKVIYSYDDGWPPYLKRIRTEPNNTIATIGAIVITQ